jgi:tetratricopeptide (TPR) repeat protein
MFPHQKLDWLIGQLETEAQAKVDDPAARLAYARALLSKGVFHGGGEPWCAQALKQAQRVLKDDALNPEALVLAGTALVGMGRNENARAYLDEALRIAPERGDLHLAMGTMFRGEGNRALAIRHLRHACALSEGAWEPHLYLGRCLAEESFASPRGARIVEEAQYHLVCALKGGPSADIQAPVIRDLGRTFLVLGRYAEAEKLFLRLREHPRYRHRARQHLGQVAFAMGKHKNAIHHLRTYIEDNPQDSQTHALIAKAYLQLGELSRAREACNKALLLDPHNVEARYTLACTVLEEGDPQEALRILKVNLRESPEHLPTYIELARTRRLGGDVPWLVQALHSEATAHDRIDSGVVQDARAHTRDRIAVILDELRGVGPSTAQAVLAAISLTQHEGLRFQLWEAATLLSVGQAADDTALKLREPGRHFSATLGRQAFAVAHHVPEPLLTRGLVLSEEDLRREAVQRFGPAADVGVHRSNIEKARIEARAHQALLLLAISRRHTRSGRNLLAHWAETADPELAMVAHIGLAVFGEPNSIRYLREVAQNSRKLARLDTLLSMLAPAPTSRAPRPVAPGEHAHCKACGRTEKESRHLLAGGDAVLCDHCVAFIRTHLAPAGTPNDARCHLCGRSSAEVHVLYQHNGVRVCSRCTDLSASLVEREDVDSFLAAW